MSLPLFSACSRIEPSNGERVVRRELRRDEDVHVVFCELLERRREVRRRRVGRVEAVREDDAGAVAIGELGGAREVEVAAPVVVRVRSRRTQPAFAVRGEQVVSL